MPVVIVTPKNADGTEGAPLTYENATVTCDAVTRLLTVTLGGRPIETHVEFQPEQYSAWRVEEQVIEPHAIREGAGPHEPPPGTGGRHSTVPATHIPEAPIVPAEGENISHAAASNALDTDAHN